jgi:3'-phosphoadenosine 5'-phosphosulfate sulfotransferase (PAPS reductase)/FAD synthetase
MANPFLLPRPAIISFSGGRTSGFMLHEVIKAYGGQLPKNIKVIYCNTGKENVETLTFVNRCEREWDCPITWLEYDSSVPSNFRKVNYETAARNGEPFEDFIQSRHIIPNATKRVCTEALKILPKNRYVKSLGWVQFHKDGNKRILDKGYANAVGLRYDEPRRVRNFKLSAAANPRHIEKEGLFGPVKVKSAKHKTKPPFGEIPLIPIAEAKITKPMILDFWKANRGGLEYEEWEKIPKAERPGFDLELHPDRDETNCDLCFLKGPNRLAKLIRMHPEQAEWWIRMEEDAAKYKDKFNQFNMNVTYKEMEAAALQPGRIPLFMTDQYAPECELTCTD